MILRISSIRKKKRRNNISRLLKSTQNVSQFSVEQKDLTWFLGMMKAGLKL